MRSTISDNFQEILNNNKKIYIKKNVLLAFSYNKTN